MLTKFVIGGIVGFIAVSYQIAMQYILHYYFLQKYPMLDDNTDERRMRDQKLRRKLDFAAFVISVVTLVPISLYFEQILFFPFLSESLYSLY